MLFCNLIIRNNNNYLYCTIPKFMAPYKEISKTVQSEINSKYEGTCMFQGTF